MSRMRILLGLAASAAVALAVGCSKSSTAPTNAAVAGSWQVTWSGLPAMTSMTHMVDTLAVTQTQAGTYTVTFTDIVYTNTAPVTYGYDPLAGGSFTVSGNNVTWVANDGINMGCYLTVTGTVSGGTSMQGTATQGGPTGCGTASWSWAAVKI